MKRVLAVSIGLVASAALSAAPAQADTTSDAFLSALSGSGVGYGDPGSTVALGQSVCPMLSDPGASFASVASRVSGNGMSPDMAALFTRIAISLYCPQMMSSFANGDWMNGGGLPIPFQIPGLPAGIPTG